MTDAPRKHLRGIGLVVAAIVVAAFLAYLWSRHAGIEELRDEARKRQHAFSAALFAPTDKYSYLPEVVAQHPVVIDALKHEDDARRVQRANTFLQRLNASAKSDTVYVLDKNGLTIASSNWQAPVSFVGKNYAFRPYFEDAMRTGAGRFYGMGITSLVPGYYLSHAIVENGATIGVAVVKIDMSTLDEGWDHRGIEITVTDENGVAFLSSRADWKYRPVHALAPAAIAQLRRTRQYDAVLKDALPLTVQTSVGPDEQIVSIEQAGTDTGAPEHESFLMQAGKLDGSSWTVNIFMPMQDVGARATRTAVLTAGALAFMLLAFMYMLQTRSRIQEREKSRRALEAAHEALEEKHTELQRLSEELHMSAITDPLTGVYNRRFFLESAVKLLSAAQRHGYPLSILMIDIDYFKRINDLYGHPAGDRVLQVMTAVCRRTLREADVFARFGGEEFIMALPNTDADAARLVAERLRAELKAHPVEVGGDELRLTVSSGISQHRPDEANIDDIIKRADEALYIAKNSGRNQIVVR